MEAHELAFGYFGGVFRTLRYDNMRSLVKKILRGRQRIETDRIIAFRSHWGYQSEYCNPAKGNEKGGVEGELGWYRRNCLTPVPEAENVAALNGHLLSVCVANRSRTIQGKEMTVGEASEHGRSSLLPLAKEGFPYEEVIYPLIVDGHAFGISDGVRTMYYIMPTMKKDPTLVAPPRQDLLTTLGSFTLKSESNENDANNLESFVQLIDFSTLASYEQYRRALADNPLHQRNAAELTRSGAVLSMERSIIEKCGDGNED